MIPIGNGGVREVDDYNLSRFACYLIAQNGELSQQTLRACRPSPWLLP